MVCFANGGAKAAFPIPTCPASVKTSTINQPWKRKLAMESAGRSRRSMGFVQKWGWGGTVFPFHSTTRVRTSVIFISVDIFPPLCRQGPHNTNRDEDQKKCCNVESAHKPEHHPVAKPMVEQIAHDQPEHNPAHSSAEADHTGNGPDDSSRKQIRRKHHDEGGPGLLTEKDKAEQDNRPLYGHMAHQQHRRHDRST